LSAECGCAIGTAPDDSHIPVAQLSTILGLLFLLLRRHQRR